MTERDFPCCNPTPPGVELRVRPAAAEVKRLRAGIEALADWHETQAEKARRLRPEINGENVIMDKAATVHDDAATRLRVLLDCSGGVT